MVARWVSLLFVCSHRPTECKNENREEKKLAAIFDRHSRSLMRARVCVGMEHRGRARELPDCQRNILTVRVFEYWY